MSTRKKKIKSIQKKLTSRSNISSITFSAATLFSTIQTQEAGAQWGRCESDYSCGALYGTTCQAQLSTSGCNMRDCITDCTSQGYTSYVGCADGDLICYCCYS